MNILPRIIFTIFFSFVVVILFSTNLIGCGGSSGGSSTPPPVVILPNVVDGVVVKGVISGGIVTAFEVSNGAVTTQVLDTAVTDEDGDYVIAIPGDYSGIVAVEITANPDTSSPSLMTCDAASGCGTYDTASDLDSNSDGVIDFGEQFQLPSDFSMRAFVSTGGGENLSINITPLTDIAAAFAETLPQGIDELSVDVGNSQVGNLFGITGDITNLEPPDLTDATDITSASDEELEYALLAAAIGGLATDSSNTVANVLDTLSQTFTDNNGQLLLNSDSNIDFGDIVQEASNTATQVANENSELADQFNTLGDMYQDEADAADSAAEGETTNAEPSPTVGSDDLDVVKAFVADVRTWGGLITFEAESAVDAFDSQISIAQELVALDTDAMGEVLGLLSDFTITMENLNLTTVDLADHFAGATGTMTYDPANLLANVDGVVEGVTVVIDITLTGNTAMTQWTFSITGNVENDNAFMSITNGTVAINFDEAFDPFADEPVDPEPVPTSASLVLTASVGQKVTSTVTDPVSFSGEIEIDVLQGVPDETATGEVEENFVPSHLGLNGIISNTTGASFNASFTINIDNAATFTPPEPPEVGSISENLASYSFNTAATELTINFPNYSLILTWDESQSAISIQCVGISGTVECEDLIFNFTSVKEYADFLIAQENGEFFGFWSAFVDDEGEYYFQHPSGVTEFTLEGGTLDGFLWLPEGPDEDAVNWIDFDFQLGFTLTLTNFPTAEVTLSGDRTGFETGEVTIEISYGARSILIELDNVTETGSITITNQDGVQLVISVSVDPENEEQVTGIVSLNDAVWADIRFVSGAYLITYADGTFESLN